jgi:predicted extracellular nuclease
MRSSAVERRGRVGCGLGFVGAAIVVVGCGAATPEPTRDVRRPTTEGAATSTRRTPALTIGSDIVISQVFGGGGNASAPFRNDFVELFNRGTVPIALAGWSVQYASATGTGNFAGNPVAALSGTLAPGGFYLIQLSGGANGAALPTPDLAPTATANMAAGAGKVVLVNGTIGLACNGGTTPCSAVTSDSIVDLVGYGSANFFAGQGAAPTLSNTAAAIRRGGGCANSNNNDLDFFAGPPQPRSGATPPAPCGVNVPPSVLATTPADGAIGVGPAAPIAVTFSEPVSVAASAFVITCDPSNGSIATTRSAGPLSFTFNPTTPLPALSVCTATVHADAVRDQDAGSAMADDFTFAFTVLAPPPLTAIHDIQGAAHISPLRGTTARTQGVVTVLRSNGFFLQEPAPDFDDATSEAIFVFTGGVPSTIVGDAAEVTGTVSEFRPGCAPSCANSDNDFANLTSTELTGPAVTILSHDNLLPPPIVIGRGPGGRVPPITIIDDDAAGDIELSGTFDPATDGADFYESLEGMRVQLNDAVAVGHTQTTSAGGFELAVLADGGADAELRTSRGGILVRAGDFNPERVILASAAIPSANVADFFTGPIVGVFDYGFGNFKLSPTEALPPLQSGGLLPESLSLPSPGAADLSVTSMNVENLDPNDPPEKFQRLAAIILKNLQAPDLLSLAEVQDNDGAKNSGVTDASTTFGLLIAAISNAGGPTYEFRAVDPTDGDDGGEPGGNIRVGFLFRTDRGLAFVDRPGGGPTVANAVVTTPTGAALAFSPGRIDPVNAAFANSRKPLAGEFTFAGAHLFVIANHFNSKGGDDPLFGRFQPPTLSSETQRLTQAQIVATFVAQIRAADPSARVIVAGDLNDFEFSAPLATLKASGLDDLVDTLPANRRYSFNYEGNAQVLDHVLVSSPMKSDLVGYDIVHVNSEFVVQASDHDPEVARFRIDTTAPVLNLPGDIVAAATLLGGATVGFTAIATDNVDGPLPVTCVPASGTTFPVGTTAVTCMATDGHGDVVTGGFTVTVVDTTSPVIATPAAVNAFATSRAGAAVAYAVPSAIDVVAGTVPVTCVPAAGTVFVPGTTTVTCAASDTSGNATSVQFPVRVTYEAPSDARFFLEPMKPDGSAVFESGATVPVRFALTGASAGITDLAARIVIARVDDHARRGHIQALPFAFPDDGDTFRFDRRTGRYLFNLGTRFRPTGVWSVKAILGDGVEHVAVFSLRR